VKVLFLGQPDNLEPWFHDVVAAVGDDAQVALYDAAASLSSQIGEAMVVVDQGGAVGTREMVDAAAAAGVRLWQVLGTGLDHVDIDYILDRGLALANTPGPFSSVALAEHALFLMLFLAKNFPACERNLRQARFYRPINLELEGATLGLVGLGASGRELARRAAAFGMQVLGMDIQAPPPDLLQQLNVAYLGGPEALGQLLAASDYVSVHVPLTSKTRHLLDERALRSMRPNSVLINVARGEIVDQAALVRALQTGWLRGAGLDVFGIEPLPLDDALLALENVVLTPHVAGVTTGTSRRRAEAVAENVRRTAAHLPPLHVVSSAE
jgi:phosphoglycerate dehydrogenase-like enzyme